MRQPGDNGKQVSPPADPRWCRLTLKVRAIQSRQAVSRYRHHRCGDRRGPLPATGADAPRDDADLTQKTAPAMAGGGDEGAANDAGKPAT